ncbi:Glucose 1-dehydrogenase 2 [Cladobotryum mycophilum]|uniref:Glucose 1-dehydrogenase 2 n=1 Tax=Cladobotryum mycophilum TaxID=491253 RepID=A0ABR0SJX9_9HYPO
MPHSPLPPRPSRSLTGKVAIVTGAGSQGDGLGNGRAISILLASDGASVMCSDLDLSSAQRTEDLIHQEGGTAIAVCADVSSDSECEALVATAIREYGRLDILVNNVGIFGAKGTAVEADEKEWARSWGVNVTSMALMAKYAIQAMLRNERDEGV